MKVVQTIEKFDKFLKDSNLEFEAIIIGGAALNILEIVTRETKDIDFLDPEIPGEIKKASIAFAKKNPSLMLDAENWMNNGPISLVRDLPTNWRSDVVLIYKGEAITFYALGRMDLLRSKIFAFADREIDFHDCIAMSPTKSELEECIPWLLTCDASELWGKRIEEIVFRLKKDLGIE